MLHPFWRSFLVVSMVYGFCTGVQAGPVTLTAQPDYVSAIQPTLYPPQPPVQFTIPVQVVIDPGWSFYDMGIGPAGLGATFVSGSPNYTLNISVSSAASLGQHNVFLIVQAKNNVTGKIADGTTYVTVDVVTRDHPSVAPEPSSAWLLSLGVIGFAVRGARRRA